MSKRVAAAVWVIHVVGGVCMAVVGVLRLIQGFRIDERAQRWGTHYENKWVGLGWIVLGVGIIAAATFFWRRRLTMTRT
jgi:uncharacterized membrane protein HdeD (DUF308 family)